WRPRGRCSVNAAGQKHCGPRLNRSWHFSPNRGISCIMLKDFDPTDYSIVVKSRAPLPRPWRWEIYCAGKRQPIKRSDVLFESREKASATGKEALRSEEHTSELQSLALLVCSIMLENKIYY